MRRTTLIVSIVLLVSLLLPLQAMACTNVSDLTDGSVLQLNTNLISKVNCYRIRLAVPDRNNQTSGEIVARYGDYKSSVSTIEKMLAQLGYNISPNKFFGYATKLAVIDFQRKNNLSANGVVDMATYNKIKEAVEQSLPRDDDANDDADNGADTPNQPPAPGGDTGNNPPGGDTGQDNTAGLTAQEQQLVNLVNQERTSRGLPALKVDMTLVKTARMKSSDMVRNNYFAHQSPTYGSPFDLMRSQGVSYRAAGENLAGAPTVESAHRNLMNSPGHRANILNSRFTHVGIGIVSGGPYGLMVTQHFVGR